jgi:hypothetical protein
MKALSNLIEKGFYIKNEEFLLKFKFCFWSFLHIQFIRYDGIILKLESSLRTKSNFYQQSKYETIV